MYGTYGAKRPRVTCYPEQTAKTWDASTTGATTLGTFGECVAISVVAGIAQGTSSTTRVGRCIYLNDLKIRFKFIKVADIEQAVTVRVLVVKDKQSNGANATLGEVLDQDADADIQAFRNMDDPDRYAILHDETFTMNTQSGAGNGTTQNWPEMKVMKNVDIKFYQPVQVTYDVGDATGANTTIRQNNIWVMVYTDRSSGTVSSTMQMDSRVKFTE